MPHMRIVNDGRHEELGAEMTRGRQIIHTTEDWTIDCLEHGMQSGATSLMVFIPAKVKGSDAVIMAEASLTNFMQAATALAAYHHDEVTKPGWAILPPAARAILGPRFHEALRRAIPNADTEQLDDAVEMILDGFGSDAPPHIQDELGF